LRRKGTTLKGGGRLPEFTCNVDRWRGSTGRSRGGGKRQAKKSSCGWGYLVCHLLSLGGKCKFAVDVIGLGDLGEGKRCHASFERGKGTQEMPAQRGTGPAKSSILSGQGPTRARRGGGWGGRRLCGYRRQKPKSAGTARVTVKTNLGRGVRFSRGIGRIPSIVAIAMKWGPQLGGPKNVMKGQKNKHADSHRGYGGGGAVNHNWQKLFVVSYCGPDQDSCVEKKYKGGVGGRSGLIGFLGGGGGVFLGVGLDPDWGVTKEVKNMDERERRSNGRNAWTWGERGDMASLEAGKGGRINLGRLPA